jgi:magnesium-transporting ATPase (P-type)
MSAEELADGRAVSAEGQPDDRGPRSKNAEEALRRFHSTRESGCSDAEARARLDREGANEVPEKPGHPVLRLAGKFWGLSAWMLELIALLSWVLHKRADFWIALALLCVNALLSFFQEQRASTAVEALRMRLQVNARVLRDAAWKLIPARDLVRGDVLRVRAGDFIPADALVLDGEVRVDQSALTGESQDLHKGANETLYSGSVVRRGEATAVVVATGVRTFFGRTAQLVESAHPRLQVEIITARLVSWLFAIVGGLVGLTLVLSAIRGLPLLDVLPLSLVLLMSAVPVALPVMFTVSTAIGSMELGRRGVLITRLAAV